MRELSSIAYSGSFNNTKRRDLASRLAAFLGLELHIIEPEALGQHLERIKAAGTRHIVLLDQESLEKDSLAPIAQSTDSLLLGFFYDPKHFLNTNKSEQILASFENYSFYINEGASLEDLQEACSDLFS